MSRPRWADERRRFVAAAAALAASAGAWAQPSCAPDGLAYVGGEDGRVHALRFDACAGRLALLGEVAQLSKPRWLLRHPALPVLYVASEDRVTAFRVDAASGALARLNEASPDGSGHTHLWLDLPSMSLLVSSFGSGSVATVAIEPDGRLGAPVSSVRASGSGPHRRQASAHAHGAVVDPSGRWALVADLGADRLFVYPFDRATRTLRPDETGRSYAAPAGSGPRRAVFSADGRFVYLLSELSAELTTLRFDAADGGLQVLQVQPVSDAAFNGTKSASEMQIGRDGCFLYVADRGGNALRVYRLTPDSGLPVLVQRLGGGGEAPWAFDLDATGRWLLVAFYRSNGLKLFRIDAESGRLSDAGPALESPAPLSVTFLN